MQFLDFGSSVASPGASDERCHPFSDVGSSVASCGASVERCHPILVFGSSVASPGAIVEHCHDHLVPSYIQQNLIASRSFMVHFTTVFTLHHV